MIPEPPLLDPQRMQALARAVRWLLGLLLAAGGYAMLLVFDWRLATGALLLVIGRALMVADNGRD